MSSTNKIVCPDCGVVMNHHAEKIDYTRPPDESSAADARFGGILEEVHSCPACGKTETRRTSEVVE
ncbi:MAG: hypothetical protein M3362_15895 [Acidobacteriota bacterium]|nr:hypothetical protein [Acidobacteriota bacterium]